MLSKTGSVEYGRNPQPPVTSLTSRRTTGRGNDGTIFATTRAVGSDRSSPTYLVLRTCVRSVVPLRPTQGGSRGSDKVPTPSGFSPCLAGQRALEPSEFHHPCSTRPRAPSPAVGIFLPFDTPLPRYPIPKSGVLPERPCRARLTLGYGPVVTPDRTLSRTCRRNTPQFLHLLYGPLYSCSSKGTTALRHVGLLRSKVASLTFRCLQRSSVVGTLRKREGDCYGYVLVPSPTLPEPRPLSEAGASQSGMTCRVIRVGRSSCLPTSTFG